MKKLYDCGFIAERYGVTIRTVWQWIRDKKLRAIKIGKEYRITEDDINEFEDNLRAEVD